MSRRGATVLLVEFFERYVAEASQARSEIGDARQRRHAPSFASAIGDAGICTDESTKLHALRSCRLMVAPSPMESLCHRGA